MLAPVLVSVPVLVPVSVPASVSVPVSVPAPVSVSALVSVPAVVAGISAHVCVSPGDHINGEANVTVNSLSASARARVNASVSASVSISAADMRNGEANAESLIKAHRQDGRCRTLHHGFVGGHHVQLPDCRPPPAAHPPIRKQRERVPSPARH